MSRGQYILTMRVIILLMLVYLLAFIMDMDIICVVLTIPMVALIFLTSCATNLWKWDITLNNVIGWKK